MLRISTLLASFLLMSFFGCVVFAKNGRLILDYSSKDDAFLGASQLIAQGERRAGVRLLESLVNEDHADATAHLGYLHLNKSFWGMNSSKGLSLLEKSIKQGSFLGTYNLAASYRHGIRVKEDRKRAFKLFKSIASKDDPYKGTANYSHAFYRRLLATTYTEIGLSLMFGKGVKKNQSKAIEWLEEGERISSALAAVNLANAYTRGYGVEIDIEKAIHFLERFELMELNEYRLIYAHPFQSERDSDLEDLVIEESVVHADIVKDMVVELSVAFGRALLSLEGESRNPKLAYQWFERAAREKHPMAEYFIASMLALGDGVEKDEKRAISLLEPLIARNEYACYNYAVLLGRLGHSESNEVEAYFQNAAARVVYSAASALSHSSDSKLLLFPKEDYEFCKEEAESGNVTANAFHAYFQLKGYWTEKDVKTGKKALKAALAAETPYGVFLMARAVDDGAFFFGKSHREYYNRAAELGVPRAQTIVANHKAKSLPRKRKMEATALFQKAISMGDPYAYQLFGNFLWREPEQFGESKSKGIDYLRKAANYGYSYSNWALGIAHMNGNGIAEDKEKALEFFRIAATGGLKTAHYYAAQLIWEIGDESEYREAIDHLKKAAAQEHLMSQIELGRRYRDGDNVDANRYYSLRYFNHAAEQGNLDALFECAKLLEQPDWGFSNPEKALSIYRKLGELNYILASYAISMCHLNGIGMKPKEQSKTTAFQYMMPMARRKAREKGAANLLVDVFNPFSLTTSSIHPNAQIIDERQKERYEYFIRDSIYQLGRMYYRGVGTDKDNWTAIDYLEKAAKQGHLEAQSYLGYVLCIVSKKRRTEGIDLLRRSIQRGDIQSMVRLGRLWAEKGITDIPEAEAIEALQKAAAQGNGKAAEVLNELNIPLDIEMELEPIRSSIQSQGVLA